MFKRTLIGAVLTAALSAQAPIPTQAPQWVLDHFQVSHATVQDIKVPFLRETFRFQVVLGHEAVTVELEPNDIRSPNFRLLAGGPNSLKQLPTPAPVTWRGRVVGRPDSVASGMIVDGKMDAMVSLQANDALWSVQSLRNVDARRPFSQYAVFSSKNDTNDKAVCGLDTTTHKHVGSSGIDMPLICEIGMDADLEYYQRNGSNTTTTQNSVTNVINGVAAIYTRDVNVDYQITTIIVRTTRTYTNTDMRQLLPEFQNRWNAQQGGTQRDVAHLFTGKGSFSGIVGIAYLGVICNRGSGYGVNKAFSSLGTNVGLVAHELGHNWNAPHCDSSNPCNIMCSGLGGCNRNLSSFGNASINVISSFRNSRNCLSQQNNRPTLTGINPSSVRSFLPQRVTLTGTEMDSVTTVNFGGQAVNSGIQRISSTQLSVVPPTPNALGNVGVSVTNSAGTSGTVPLNFTDTRPAILLAPTFGFRGVPLNYSFGGDDNDRWFLIVNFDRQTVRFSGFDILINNLSLGQGSLNAVGIGGLSFPVPNVNLSGLIMYSQLVALDETQFVINDATTPATTRFF